jgi:predicted O-methyltransferase YrrM
MKSITSTDDKDIEKLLIHSRTCRWLEGYGAVSSIIKSIEARTILEVGVAYGYHAIHMLSENPNLIYTGIDPYISDYDPSDQFSRDVEQLFPIDDASVNGDSEPMDRLHSAVTKLVKLKSNTAQIIRASFHQFSKMHRNEFFDLIYIDGDHQQDAVFLDVILSTFHNNENGIICGDDIERDSVRTGLDKACKVLGVSYSVHQHAGTKKLIWILNKQ